MRSDSSGNAVPAPAAFPPIATRSNQSGGSGRKAPKMSKASGFEARSTAVGISSRRCIENLISTLKRIAIATISFCDRAPFSMKPPLL